MKDIEAGYQIVVSSWENDLDSPKDITLSGLSEELVRFYIDFLNNFESNSHDHHCYGNVAIEDDILVDLVHKMLAKHPKVAEEITTKYGLGQLPSPEGDDDEEYTDYVSESYYRLVADLLGGPENEFYQEEHNFCRVVENVEVYFIPQPIKNVTKDFW